MVRSSTPASVAATWPAPNFVDPVTKGPALQVLSILLLVITFSVIALRVYARAYLLRSFGTDDWLITICLLPAILLNTTAFIANYYGWNVHYWDQKPEWYVPSEQISFIIQIGYIFCQYFSKTSLLFSYLRFLSGRKIRIFTWVTIGVIFAWGMGCLWSTVFDCNPPKLYWESFTGDGCVDETPRFLVCVVVNIITDIIVVAIPAGTIWTIKIVRRERIVLFALMSIGIVATIASIVRTVVMDQALNNYDETWYGYNVWVWTIVECNLAIICSCIPTLRPVGKKFFNLVHASSSGTSNNTRQTRQNEYTLEERERTYKSAKSGKGGLKSPMNDADLWRSSEEHLV